MSDTTTVSALLFQHTAARRRLPLHSFTKSLVLGFQHTAARRRLRDSNAVLKIGVVVSTHSRPKAAAIILTKKPVEKVVSTHSRPKAAATNGLAMGLWV